MILKRYTIDVYDTEDTPQTTIPIQFPGLQNWNFNQTEQQATPENQKENVEQEIANEGEQAEIQNEITGRTIPDLIDKYLNSYELIVVFLLLGFVISIGKFEDITDIWRPLVIGISLSVCWGVIKLIKWIMTKKNNKQFSTPPPPSPGCG